MHISISNPHLHVQLSPLFASAFALTVHGSYLWGFVSDLKNIFSRYLNAIQTSAPHLLRYLATAFIVNKRRRPQFKDFIKVIQQEQHSYKDPITEFLACVYVNYDFDGAQKKMKECEEVRSSLCWLAVIK